MKIAVFTGTRAEYGILKPVLLGVQNHPDLNLSLFVGGTHLLTSFGNTQDQILKDGFAIAEKIPFLKDGADTHLDIAQATGSATQLIAAALHRQKPDALVILGDRFEALAAASAALLMNVPIVHLFGGESTQGAVDEQIRHAITKMAHIHCTPTDDTAARIRQMGEESWRIFVTGHPALEALKTMSLSNRSVLESDLGGAFKDTLYIITYHPETLNADTMTDLDEILGALKDVAANATLIITYPNADAGNVAMIEKLKTFADTVPDARVFESLGQARYYGLLSIADAMIGNSSSGILEAPSFDCPAINIGDRQKGRIRASSVIDAPANRNTIGAAIKGIRNKDYSNTHNPYVRDNTVQIILDAIATIPHHPDILIKRFMAQS